MVDDHPSPSVAHSPSPPIAKFFGTYHPDIFNLVVPPLADSFPSLRRVVFGGERKAMGPDSWVVHMGDKREGGVGRGPGHIELIRTLHLASFEAPPQEILPPNPPSQDYTLAHRFDLRMWSIDIGMIPDYTRWREFFQSCSDLGHLHKSVNFAGIDVSFDDIITLFNKQIAAGHQERIQEITARCLRWNPDEFHRFAKVATTLVRLVLGPNLLHYEYYKYLKVSLADLPSLVTSIRSHLPNLQHLETAIDGIATAEALCLGMLDHESLEPGGSIATLKLLTPEHQTPLFNVIRALSPILTSSASIIIKSNSYEAWAGTDEQSRYLHYLRQQPPHRRHHLAIGQFDHLNVVTPSDVYSLHYHDDGRPIPLSPPNLAQFVEQATIVVPKPWEGIIFEMDRPDHIVHGSFELGKIRREEARVEEEIREYAKGLKGEAAGR